VVVAASDLAHEVLDGVPDEMLVQVAEAEQARLIVVASLGRRPPLRWPLGSIAERTAQTSPGPSARRPGRAGARDVAAGRVTATLAHPLVRPAGPCPVLGQ
jgi:hypothetical protein